MIGETSLMFRRSTRLSSPRSTSVRRFGLGPVEVVDIEGDPVPAPGEKLRRGIELRNLARDCAN